MNINTQLRRDWDLARDLSASLRDSLGFGAELEVWETGGGCTAGRLQLNFERYLLITSDDLEMPAPNETVTVGWYADNDAEEAYCLLQFADWVAFLNFAELASSMFTWGDFRSSQREKALLLVDEVIEWNPEAL